MNHSESPPNIILNHDSNISITSDRFQDKTKFLSFILRMQFSYNSRSGPSLSSLAFYPLTSSQAVFIPILSNHWHFSKMSICLHVFFSYFWNVLPLLLWLTRAHPSGLSIRVLYEALPKSRGDFDALPLHTSMITPVVYRLVYLCEPPTKYKSPEIIRGGVLFFISISVSLKLKAASESWVGF